MIPHSIRITLLVSVLIVQTVSIPWNKLDSPISHANHRSGLTKLQRRSLFDGSSATNRPFNIDLSNIKEFELLVDKDVPIAEHFPSTELVIPPTAHSITGVSAMHRKGITGKGIKIGIIDTGIDYTHPALGGNDPVTRRVQYGHDFVGNAFKGGKRQPSDDPMDCIGHGTMVAGIIGAKTSAVVGVAPDAILGAYKITGCDPTFAFVEGMEEVMAMAFEDGMDIVNMSFGSGIRKAKILAKVIEEYAHKNIIILGSVPNNGESGVMGWSADVPGILPSVLSVGGMEIHYKIKDSFYVSYNGYNKEIAYTTTCGSSHRIQGMLQVVVVKPPAIGVVCDVPTNAKDNIVFVASSVCNMVQLMARAVKRGAVAVIAPRLRAKPVICTLPILRAEPAFTLMVNRLTAYGKLIMVNFNDHKKAIPQRSTMMGSVNSAWGPTAQFRLSPEIVAPSDNLITTIRNGYVYMHGNSGAAPYLAGMAALYFEHCDKNGKTRPNYSQLRSLLQNNAIPYMVPGKNLAGSVAHQGAGMAHIGRMIKSTFSASPSAIELSDIKQRSTLDYTKSASITIRSNDTNTQTLYLRHIPAVSMRAFHANGKATEEIVTTNIHIEATFTGPQVITLKPNDKVSVPITFTIPVELNYDEHWVYSGYIVIDTKAPVNGKPPSNHAVYVPYLGLNGNIKTITKLFKLNGKLFYSKNIKH